MPPPPTTPPRLHVILARESSRAIVIRRGPSKHTCTVGWDRQTDEFTMGQWLKGRIYERRCDLSPRGEHFIYFAMNGRWMSETRGSWTAISRAPYLEAIGLWPKGDCWNGGGVFIDDKHFWLNGHAPDVAMLRPRHLHASPCPESFFAGMGECPLIYYPRLQRDGWKEGSSHAANDRSHTTHFSKRLPGGWMLHKLAQCGMDHGRQRRPVYFDEHALMPPDSSKPLEFPSWEWCDADARRL